MPRAYSSEYKSTLNSVGQIEPALVCLEITHPSLSQPVRVVNDSQDLTSNGDLFIAAPFRVTLPDDFENRLPRASIAIDNVGRELVYWIETSGGGEGAIIRFIQLLRSNPDLVEWEITMNMNNVNVTMQEITADLGFDNIFNKPAVRLQYRPENSGGMF